MEESAINMDKADAEHERPRTFSFMSGLYKEKRPYRELLNISLAVSLTVFEITSGQQPIENVLGNLQHSKFIVSLFKAQV